MAPQKDEEQKSLLKIYLKAIYEFGVHLLVGSTLFILIALAADWLDQIIILLNIKDVFIREILLNIKYAIFILDCALFVVFLCSSTIHIGKKLWIH